MEVDIDILDNVLESLLFASGDSLKIDDICEQLELQKSEIKASVKRLQKKYSGKCGIRLISFNGQLQLASNSDYSEIIESVLNPIKEKALSTPAMETLSIIAYRQPVTRLDLEHIRGVNCDYALDALYRSGLVEIVGRKDTIGRPWLYGTTDAFLKRFAIEDISQLPGREELLEKIKNIEESTDTPSEEHLYNFADPEKPDFLEGEDVVMIDADGEPEAAATDDGQK